MLYPFGQSLKPVTQKNKSPKDLFILGVYASAVHAKWIGADGKEKVKALAVASEPEIFWKGENAEKIIAKIKIPAALGKLVPAHVQFNGPSGKALDDLYIKPLGLNRADCWLSDLLPETRINNGQQKAIDRAYNPIKAKNKLNDVTIPTFKKTELNSKDRAIEILDEIKQSKSSKIVLLGDLPIQKWLKHFAPQYSKLTDFVKHDSDYGKLHELKIDGNEYQVLPLCHPRQAGKLGRSSNIWFKRHQKWVDSKPKF